MKLRGTHNDKHALKKPLCLMAIKRKYKPILVHYGDISCESVKNAN